MSTENQVKISRLRIAWVIPSILSFLCMVFFRSQAGHGPDAVGREVLCFAGLLILSFLVAMAAAFTDGAESGRLLLMTVGLAVVEAIIYSWLRF